MKTVLLIGSLRSPPPIRAAPDFPLFRGQNKTPRNTLFINGSTISAGYSAPACGGKVVAPATKGGIAFPRPSERLYGFPAAAGGISNSPLNQPALWAEPIVRCAAHERWNPGAERHLNPLAFGNTVERPIDS